MKMFKKPALLLLVLALLMSGTSVAVAQADQDDDYRIFVPLVATQTTGEVERDVVTVEVSLADQEAALAFWTHERVAAAQPIEGMAQAGPVEVDAAALTEQEVSGPAGFQAPGRAAANADQVARAAYAADWAAAEAATEDDATLEAGLAAEAANQPQDTGQVEGTSQIYTSYIANWLSTLQTQYPHRWVGRLSFTTPAGTSYCSATAISGNNFVTAAHCVYDTPSRNRFYSNWVFTPAYRNGSAPYGSFAATQCTVLNNWITRSGNYSINGWARYDVAVCTVGRNSAGQTLNSAVGYAGKAWNYNYTRHVYNLGYPFRNYADGLLSWAGAYLRLCSAETFQQTTDTRGMGCSWSRGNSGGPWIDHRFLSTTAYGTDGYWPGRVSGYVTGVYSGFSIGSQNAYAPRFTSSNIVPLCNVRGC